MIKSWIKGRLIISNNQLVPRSKTNRKTVYWPTTNSSVFQWHFLWNSFFFLPIPKSFGEMMSISQFNVEQPAAAFVLFQAYHLRSVASCCDCSLVNLEQGPIFGYQVRADCLDNEHDKNLYDGQLWRYY